MTLRCWSLVSRPWHYQRNPNISNYPFLSFDIETNSMRKCLLKLFSLLQKKEFQPQSLKYPNRRGANWSFQVSACLSPWTWTTVESQHFGVCLRWVLTIKYNWWQYDTIQNQKRNFFSGNNESNTQDGENVARRIQRQFFKKQRWATVYCPQVFISGH